MQSQRLGLGELEVLKVPVNGGAAVARGELTQLCAEQGAGGKG